MPLIEDALVEYLAKHPGTEERMVEEIAARDDLDDIVAALLLKPVVDRWGTQYGSPLNAAVASHLAKYLEDHLVRLFERPEIADAIIAAVSARMPQAIETVTTGLIHRALAIANQQAELRVQELVSRLRSI